MSKKIRPNTNLPVEPGIRIDENGVTQVPGSHLLRMIGGRWTKVYVHLGEEIVGDEELQDRMLAELAVDGIVGAAARRVGIPRHHHLVWVENDPKYRALARRAVEDAMDRKEEEAHRRAFLGVDKPVFHDGEEIATVKEYSDKLAVEILRADRPQRFLPAHYPQQAPPSTVEGDVLVVNVSGPEGIKALEQYHRLRRQEESRGNGHDADEEIVIGRRKD